MVEEGDETSLYLTEDDMRSPTHANTCSELPSQVPLAVGKNTYLEIDAATDPGVPKVD